MGQFFWLLFVGTFILIAGLVEVLLLRLLNRTWWDVKLIRYLALSLPVIGLVMLALWGLGAYRGWPLLSFIGAAMTAFTFVMEVALMLSLPVSGALHLLNRIWDFVVRRVHRRVPEQPIDRKRRAVLKGIAAAVPTVTAAMAVGGITRAFGSVNVPVEPVSIAGLGTDLDGLKILQLSDLHLRHYVTLADLEAALAEAAPHAPDLVLITGDVADDLAQLPGALAMIADLNVPLGAFAVLGNHEYFQGVGKVRRIYDRSTVPLLINDSARIAVGTDSLLIAGIDDPRRMGVDHSDFFRTSIADAVAPAVDSDTVVLMSHRPEAFDAAADAGVHLTLAGHTHGGQIGLTGKSLLQVVRPEGYFWGHYRRNGRHMYLTSGLGHWFPFRLGCPPEAPIIQLRRS